MVEPCLAVQKFWIWFNSLISTRCTLHEFRICVRTNRRSEKFCSSQWVSEHAYDGTQIITSQTFIFLKGTVSVVSSAWLSMKRLCTTVPLTRLSMINYDQDIVTFIDFKIFNPDNFYLVAFSRNHFCREIPIENNQFLKLWTLISNSNYVRENC